MPEQPPRIIVPGEDKKQAPTSPTPETPPLEPGMIAPGPKIVVNTLEELAKPGWVQLDMGAGPFMGRIEVDNPPPPDKPLADLWKDPVDAEVFVNNLVSSGRVVRYYWPVMMRKVSPTQDAFIAYIPDPEGLPKTMYPNPYVLVNMSRVSMWALLAPLRNKGIVDFFKKFFEDEGGRIMQAPPGLAQQMAGGAMPRGQGPIGRRLIR